MELEPINSSIIPFEGVDAQKIETWPHEIVKEIFDSLNELDLQRLARVSRIMNDHVIKTVNYNAPLSLKKFVQFCIQLFPKKRDEITQISTNIDSQNFANLQLMKNYILDSKIQLINVLKTMNPATLSMLKVPISSLLLQDTFKLSEAAHRIDKANLSLDISDFADISNYLIINSKIDKSTIAIIMLISNQFYRDQTLKEIAIKLVKVNTSEAIDAAMLISNEYDRNIALEKISKVLAKAGNMKAVDVCLLISDEQYRNEVLGAISLILAKAGNMKAVDVCLLISDEENRNRVLDRISMVLAEAENIKAVDVCLLISDEENKNDALRRVSIVFAKAGNIKAVEICLLISDEDDRNTALQQIPLELARAGTIKALYAAAMISDEFTRDLIFQNISLEFLIIGSSMALDAAMSISNKFLRDQTLQKVYIMLNDGS